MPPTTEVLPVLMRGKHVHKFCFKWPCFALGPQMTLRGRKYTIFPKKVMSFPYFTCLFAASIFKYVIRRLGYLIEARSEYNLLTKLSIDSLNSVSFKNWRHFSLKKKWLPRGISKVTLGTLEQLLLLHYFCLLFQAKGKLFVDKQCNS